MTEPNHLKYFKRSSLFSIEDFPLFVNRDNLVEKDWHEHDFFELVLVGGGYGEQQLSSKKSFGIIQGDVFAVPVKQPHRYIRHRDMYIYNVLFDFSLFQELELAELMQITSVKTLFQSAEYKLHLPMFVRMSAEKLLRQMMSELVLRPLAFRLNIKAMLIEFLVLLGREKARGYQTLSNNQQAIHRVLVFLEEHFAEKISLQDISHYACMNKNYFCKSFHAETGTTPWNYLVQLRLEHVKKLLSETNLSICEIALKSGFCDQSYMARIFKTHEGISPNKFRNSYQESQLILAHDLHQEIKENRC